MTDAFDAGEPADVNTKSKKDRERERSKEDFIRAALSQREGRIWFWDFLSGCGVFRNPWTANALVTAFNSGEMNKGQEVLAEIIRLQPDFLATMIKENQDG